MVCFLGLPTCILQFLHIHVDMVIGFRQRSQTVQDIDRQFPLVVYSLRASERDYEVRFRHEQSTSTDYATVDSRGFPKLYPMFDALFGLWSEDNLLEDSGTLRAFSLELHNPPKTVIVHDFRPEPEECYTIRILRPDVGRSRQSFECNEDTANSTDFFCRHTICIPNNDG